MSQSHKDPSEAAARFFADDRVGTVLEGTVTSVVHFGAFVELTPGVDGLLHETEWQQRPQLGDRVTIRVAAVDPERRRVSLQLT